MPSLEERVAEVFSGLDRYRVEDIDGNPVGGPSLLDTDLNVAVRVPTVRAIAAGLSAMPRFCGQTERVYTVAEHSIYVAKSAMREAIECGWSNDDVTYAGLCGLFHDGAEAFVADVPKPIKDLMTSVCDKAYQTIENRLLNAILVGYACPYHREFKDLVKTHDRIALLHEMRDLREGKDYDFLPRFKIVPIGDREVIRLKFVQFARDLGCTEST